MSQEKDEGSVYLFCSFRGNGDGALNHRIYCTTTRDLWLSHRPPFSSPFSSTEMAGKRGRRQKCC